MALIGAILVEIKIIEILCERSLREGDRYALNHGKELLPYSIFIITRRYKRVEIQCCNRRVVA